MTRFRFQRPTLSVACIALAACAVAACGSSASHTADAAERTTTTNPTPTTSTAAIPSPFQMHQRFGVGTRWEITTAAARRHDGTFSVSLDVVNDGPGTATFAAATPGLFTMLDEYANVPQHPSAPVSSVLVPDSATREITLHFAGLSSTAAHPVLWFHGHLLAGTTDASVWFSGV